MFGNSHSLRGSSTRAMNLAPYWRTVLIALVLALAIGSVGQTSPAQAAPPAADPPEIKFELGIAPENPPILCINKKLTLYVSVSKTVIKYINDKRVETPGSAPAPQITGVVSGGPATLVQQLQDIDGVGDAIPFVFTAQKPGTFILKFTAPIQNKWIGANEVVSGSGAKVEKQITVKVGCKVKVNTVSTFKVGMTSVGTMDGEMKADEQGNFTGSATVNWVTSMLCGISSPIDPSQADLTGTFNESGQLTGQVTFGPMSSSGGGNCLIASVTTSNFGTLDPLTIKASSDGVSVYTQAQTVTATNGSFPGTATIVVIPEEDEAAAFNPGDHQARWDDFSSLFGALLALP